jgi:hypothetical protein
MGFPQRTSFMYGVDSISEWDGGTDFHLEITHVFSISQIMDHHGWIIYTHGNARSSKVESRLSDLLKRDKPRRFFCWWA